jgi:hypothetical protein
MIHGQLRVVPGTGTSKNGFDPLKKFEPLNGVMFVQRTWTLTKNALERAVNRENLFLVMYCIYLLRSTIDFEVVVLLIIVLA